MKNELITKQTNYLSVQVGKSSCTPAPFAIEDGQCLQPHPWSVLASGVRKQSPRHNIPHVDTSMCLDHIISGIQRARRKVILNPRKSSSGSFPFPLLLLFSLLYISLSLGRSNTDKSNHLLAPPIRIG